MIFTLIQIPGRYYRYEEEVNFMYDLVTHIMFMPVKKTTMI